MYCIDYTAASNFGWDEVTSLLIIVRVRLVFTVGGFGRSATFATRRRGCSRAGTRLQNELTALLEAGFKRNRNKHKLQTKTSEANQPGI